MADPPTLDPHLTTDATSATIIVEVFGGLVTIDPNLQIVGDLASHWEVLNDGKTYVFHIRSNATFHDGRQVTAQDVKWSMERAPTPKPCLWWLTSIWGISSASRPSWRARLTKSQVLKWWTMSRAHRHRRP